MLISVLLQSTAATPPSPPPLCITVHHRDTITDIHVESVISSLKLQFSKLDSFNADFNVYDGPPNLKAFLGEPGDSHAQTHENGAVPIFPCPLSTGNQTE